MPGINLSDCTIVPLADHPQWVSLVARWQHQQWQLRSQTGSLAERESRLREQLLASPFPVTFIAFAADHEPPVGCVSLVDYRFNQTRPASIWLANLYVEPDWRYGGLGSLLLDYATGYARQHRLPKLFLFTHDHRKFYELRGWQWLRQHTFGGNLVDIMANVFA